MTPEQQVRDLQTDTTAFGATDIRAMENRVIAMEMLYKFAGRDNPEKRGKYFSGWPQHCS